MANCATRAGLRLGNPERFANSRGACIEQNGGCASVKIFLRPGNILAAFFPGAAMATRRVTTGGADKFSGLVGAHDRALANRDEQ